MNQVSTLQTNLNSRALITNVYTKAENDVALNLKVTKTDLATNLTILTAKVGLATATATLSVKGDSSTDSFVLASTKGQSIICGFGGLGDSYLRSHSLSGLVALNDNDLGKITIGTSTVSAGYQLTCAGSAIFLSDMKISGVLANISIKMNAPTSTASALIIKDNGTTNSALIIESSKCGYISQFGAGLGGNVDIRSSLRSSAVSIQDMGVWS